MGKIRVNMENKKTALNSLHIKYGAKLVSFAGYEMPIQYSSGIIEEHKSTIVLLCSSIIPDEY